ncbi:hypothetical protein VN12_19785 [Pirellula sp. SH-Sr6A]|uniref:hypothetical protein n=1 Tax=Pirellula sp. SH-Sr6A TaxID=1632865 RepID=UPI00078B91F5|nr:hypothetical protein [Pirellula sp. SH-Sr6A]AMV34376.1 hypothetical protein VN12_19785 [Pirellula sp. SH-Sr6A]
MTDTDIIELFRERVAIMVIDGGVNEAEANKVAFYETARLVGVEPKAMPQQCKDELRRAVANG